MKKILPILLLAPFALTAFGDASYMILQKARDVANTTPTGQGPAPRQPPGQPAPAKPMVPSAPQLPPAQQAIVNELAVANTNNTQRLSHDLIALARGAQKPSPATLDKLALNLEQAVTGHPVPAAQRARIAQDIETVFSSATNLPPECVEAFIVDVPLVLKSLGVESAYTAAVGNDLRAARKEVLATPTPAAAH